MSSALSFVPHKVAKTTRNQARRKGLSGDDGRSNNGVAPPRTAVIPSQAKATQEDVKGKGKAKADERGSKFTDVDYAHLVCLALSDYALWLDPDLRRALDPGQVELSETGPYVPINNIFKRFPTFGIDSPPMTVVVGIVKALRACAVELVDARLTLEEPSLLVSDGWQAGEISSPSLGGYEIRRKDWTRESVPEGLLYSKRGWDDRTIYVERIPTPYRNVPGILRLIPSLLVENPTSRHLLTRIQGVTLPAHRLDKPGDPPAFKDFCLVTFTTLEDAEFITKQWHWARKPADRAMAEAGNEFDAVKEASKFGLRTLTKTHWEHLRQEYLSYRTKLIKEIGDYEDSQAETQTPRKRFRAREADTPEQSLAAKDNNPRRASPKPTRLSLDAPYPYGCLVFVRNIHPETNKTTLRALFSPGLKAEKKGGLKEDGLDYVDFNKGMDSCHLRLSTPMHADVLVSHFKNSVVQAHGLDDKGTRANASLAAKPIALEKVLGRREEVYWERVPEKVREQAVQKAITLAGLGVDANTDKNQSEANVGPRRKKKRNN